MANRFYLDREIVKKVKDQDSIPVLKIYDDYGTDCYIVESLPEDDLDCLKMCIDLYKEERCEQDNVLDGLFESEKGINIDNTFYDWDEIKHLFDDWK
jgi:hypothetical protein